MPYCLIVVCCLLCHNASTSRQKDAIFTESDIDCSGCNFFFFLLFKPTNRSEDLPRSILLLLPQLHLLSLNECTYVYVFVHFCCECYSQVVELLEKQKKDKTPGKKESGGASVVSPGVSPKVHHNVLSDPIEEANRMANLLLAVRYACLFVCLVVWHTYGEEGGDSLVRVCLCVFVGKEGVCLCGWVGMCGRVAWCDFVCVCECFCVSLW